MILFKIEKSSMVGIKRTQALDAISIFFHHVNERNGKKTELMKGNYLAPIDIIFFH